jgi:divalent metal cation (Fe/Co/Zn/Cd) transporter
MSNLPSEDGGDFPIVSAVVVGILVFLVGTCVIQSGVALVVSAFSKDLYIELLGGRSPANPFWKPWWGYWCLCAGNAATAFLMAVVLARRTYRNLLLKAQRLSFERRREPRVVQFSLKSLLLFQLYVAIGLGAICWLGHPIVPCVLGVFGAMAGYGATLFWGRRRLFDVIVAYFVGVIVALLATTSQHSRLPTLQEEERTEQMRNWTNVTVPPTLLVVAFVAKWRLRKRNRLEL